MKEKSIFDLIRGKSKEEKMAIRKERREQKNLRLKSRMIIRLLDQQFKQKYDKIIDKEFKEKYM